MIRSNKLICLGMIFFLLFPIPWAFADSLNQGLLKSPQNLQADITLTQIPLGLVGVGDVITIKWTPQNPGVFRYSPVPGGADPANYPLSLPEQDLLVNTGGEIQFLGEKLPAGIHYCIITSGSDHSVEFMVIRESEVSPRPISPKTAEGEEGIATNSPVFSWEGVTGVPFYHVILSDQPFTITEDEEGNTRVEGANIIWQAITPETSIPYGTPDPSGFFLYSSPPPLVHGVRYNWVVLNNYGNNPALTSSVTSGPVGFEVAVPPPFDPPVNIEPANGSIVISDVVTFLWSQVEGASLYHIYLSKLEEVRGSSVLAPVWDGVTSNTLIDLQAGGILQNGKYYWKVLAQDESGNGAMGDTTSFYYSTLSGTANIYTTDLNGNPLPRTNLTVESLTHGMNPIPLATDDTGYLDREFPLGSYRVTAAKEGYEDTTATFEISVDGENVTVILALRESPSSLYGSTKDSNLNPLSFVTIHAVSQTTQEERETSSDLNGNFTLGLSSGSWILTASKPGYKSSDQRSIYLSPGQTLNLDDPANGGPFILIQNTYTLSGTVTTPSDEAVWGAEVKATGEDQEEVTVSNAQGQYSLTLTAGDWTLTVTKEGYVSPQPQVVTIIDHNISLNLTLTPRANIISGTVTSGGVALNEAEVKAIPTSGQVVSTLTDPYGQYTLSLSRGTYEIFPQKEGYVSPEPKVFTLDVGQTISGVNFTMEPEESYVIGKVTTDGVTPLPGATISNGTETTTTDPDGRYTLGMSAGSYTISASKEGYMAGEPRQVTLGPGQTLSGIDFVLSPNASVISGTITSGGLPVYRAQVTAREQDLGTIFSSESGEDGSYSLSLNAGTYILKVTKTGFISNPDSLLVSVAPGQTIPNQDFSLIENVSYILGSVKSGTTPLRNANIEVTAIEDPAQTFTTETGVDGSFSISVTPGYSFRVEASKAGYNSQIDTTSQLDVGERVTLQFDLIPHQSVIKGQIFQEGGSPLSGATVQATSDEKVFSAQSDLTGHYSLGVDAGSYALIAQKAGFLSQSTAITIGVGDTLSGVDFTLRPNFASLDGRITDSSTGASVEGGLVVATELTTGNGGSAYSDPQGYYLIQNLIPGTYRVSVTHPSYQQASLSDQLFAGGSANHINFQLIPKNGRIEGSVTSEGVGITGATVTATSPSGERTSSITGADGSYSIQNLLPNTYIVQASLTGYTSSQPETLQVKADSTSRADFTLTPNEGKITGFVKEGTLGIGGAKVIAMGQGGNSGSSTSAPDGSYTISHLAVDTYRVYVDLSGYISSPQDTTITIGPGETKFLNFELSRSVIKISGSVKDQRGNPLPNVPVVASSPKGEGRGQTDTDGNFQLENLPTNAQYRVWTDIFEQGYDNTDTTFTVEEADVTGIELRVGVHRSKIRGNVGIVGVTLTAQNQQRGLSYSTLSQPDGSYLFDNLYDGDYVVSAFKVGYIATPPQQSVENLGIGEERDRIDFVLTPIRITISGKVTDTKGAPLPDVPVIAWSTEATGRDTTGADGSYSIGDLPPNLNYTLGTELPPADYENAHTTLQAGETDLSAPDLVVSVHNSVVEGRVTTPSGQPVKGVLVTLLEINSSTATDDDGYYHFYHLYSGSYTLTLFKMGFEEVQPTTFDLSQGERKVLNFTLIPFLNSVYGVVRGPDGRLKNAVVEVLDEAIGEVVGRDTTDPSGIYNVKNLEIGKIYTVRALKKGYRKSEKFGIDISGGSVSLDFYMEPFPNSLYGTVVRQTDGREQEGAIVRINGLSGGTWLDSTNTFGDFSIRDLTRGSYTLTARKNELMSLSVTVSLSPGAAVRKNLILGNPGSVEGVVSYSGKGVAGATITVANVTTGAVAAAVSDTNGYYILGLQDGDYSLSCAIPGFDAENSPQFITIHSGSKEIVDFNLSAEANSVIGKVYDTDSHPLSGVKVILSGENLKDSTLTDLNGRYHIGSLPDGIYTVTASLFGYHDPPPDTVTLTDGHSVFADFYLSPIINSIFGVVRDGNTSSPLMDAIVEATDSQGNVFVDTTESNGRYLFTLPPGSYQLQAKREDYYESQKVDVFLEEGGFVLQDFLLLPIPITASISGKVHHGTDPVEGARISLSSLTDPSLRRSTYSAADGGYRFDDLPVPADYLLTASKSGYPSLTSPVLHLTRAGLDYDFGFPCGQIRFKVTREGSSPLPGIRIKVSGKTDTLLVTDQKGECETKDYLREGDYKIMIEGGENLIPPVTYTVHLPQDSVLVDQVCLPFYHIPVKSASAKDSIRIEVLSFAPLQDTLWLYYKGVDKLQYSRRQMLPSQIGGSDTTRLYAFIPSQGRTGEVSYYIKTDFEDRIYSNESNPYKITITLEGIMTRVEMIPAEKEVPPGVPTLLRVKAYDGVNNPLVPEEVNWEIIQGQGELTPSAEDKTKAFFKSSIDTTTMIQATVSLGEVTLRASARIITRRRVLASLEVTSSTGRTKISNQDSILFIYSALDTSGASTSIYPLWDYEPKNSGVLIPNEDRESALFRPNSDYIGQVRIFLTDSLSGMRTSFHSGGGISLADEGLTVYQLLTSETPEVEVTDGEGFYLTIPQGAVYPGTRLEVSLKTPQIPDVKKCTPRYEVLGKIYDVTATGEIKEGVKLTLKLPLKGSIRNPSLGYWDVNSLSWVVVQSTREGDKMVARISHFSQYAVLKGSDPLNIKDVKLVPNPFTPYDPYGLQIGFTLSSMDTRRPYVTVKIYNMAGELVRTLCENKPMTKGCYSPGEEGTLMWDGRTDGGGLARNGRYLVLIEARDASGIKKVLKTVTLIK